MEILVEIMIDNDTWAKLGRFSTRDELEEYGKRNPECVNLLDEQGLWHHIRENLVLSTHNDDGVISSALFGVHGGLHPILVVWDHASKVVCGVDESVIAVSWAGRDVIYHATTGGFVQFLMPAGRDSLVAWVESALTCFNDKIQEAWYWLCSDQVIDDVRIRDDVVEIVECGVPDVVRLNLHDGSEIK